MKNKQNIYTLIISISPLLVIILIVCGGLIARSWNEKKNQQATEYMLSGDYETALLLFEDIKDFNGVDEKIRECERKLGYELCPECGYVLRRRNKMNEDKKLYAVTSGEYSDYHIVGIFSDKIKAEEFVKIWNESCAKYDRVDIEEYTDGILCTTNGPMWCATFRKIDGNYILVSTSLYILQTHLNKDIEHYKEVGLAYVYVRAKKSDVAEKIAEDLFTKYLAEEEGI